MKRRALVFVLLGIWAICLLGLSEAAEQGEEKINKELLEPEMKLKFPDIPVPTGFKFLPQDSYTFESSGVRVGVLRYKGKAEPEQVINFYREQMPMFNWNLLNVIEYGERLINFERDNETCIIRLLPKGRSVIIIISMGPKSGGLIKPEKTVK